MSGLCDESGQITHLVGVAVDISHAKKIEAVLSEKERFLSALIENCGVLIFAKNRDGEYLMINRKWEEYTNLSRQNVLGKTDAELFPEAIANQFRNNDLEVMASETVITKEEILEHPDGPNYFLSSKFPLLNNQGEITGICGVTSDITERKKLEMALHKSHSFLKDLIENWPEPMLLTKESVFIDANPAAIKLLGYPNKEALLNLTMADISPPLQPDGQQTTVKLEELKAQIQQGAVLHFEWLHLRYDGSEIHMDVTLSPVELDNRHVILCAWHDITELKQARQEAERLANYRSAFLADMSHEIRTPMNAIIGLSELALSLDMQNLARDYLEQINASSTSLLGILNDILDFSKIDSGKLQLEKRPLALYDLLENLRKLFSTLTRVKGIGIDFDIDPAIPQLLMGDALRIQQILSNLLGNAIKFTDQGGVQLQLKLLDSEANSVRIRFIVTDTGIGIAKNDQNRLFQPFNQLDASTTRQYGGSGLGLAISQSLLQMMDSGIHIDSELGKGSSFSFDLRMDLVAPDYQQEADQQPDPRYQANARPDKPPSRQTLAGTHLLVAEDNPVNQIVINAFLTRAGVTVDIANNGEEALQLIAKNTYDAVLMDIQMPVLDGMETTKQIRQQERFNQLPVIALTAGVTQQEYDKCLVCGIDDFVSKPVNFEILTKTLLHWLGTRL